MRGCGSLKTADAFLANGGLRVVVASSLSRPYEAKQVQTFGRVFSLVSTGLVSEETSLKGRGSLLFTHNHFEGFDPGSERTLAAWIRHASRMNPIWVTGWGKWRKGQ
jgi:hypothetical protein